MQIKNLAWEHSISITADLLSILEGSSMMAVWYKRTCSSFVPSDGGNWDKYLWRYAPGFGLKWVCPVRKYFWGKVVGDWDEWVVLAQNNQIEDIEDGGISILLRNCLHRVAIHIYYLAPLSGCKRKTRPFALSIPSLSRPTPSLSGSSLDLVKVNLGDDSVLFMTCPLVLFDLEYFPKHVECVSRNTSLICDGLGKANIMLPDESQYNAGHPPVPYMLLVHRSSESVHLTWLLHSFDL